MRAVQNGALICTAHFSSTKGIHDHLSTFTWDNPELGRENAFDKHTGVSLASENIITTTTLSRSAWHSNTVIVDVFHQTFTLVETAES